MVTTNKEADDKSNEEDEDPGEDYNENCNPESYPPIDGTIRIEEGRTEPHQNEGKYNPCDEHSYDKVDDPVEDVT